jgi:hypothetical protein
MSDAPPPIPAFRRPPPGRTVASDGGVVSPPPAIPAFPSSGFNPPRLPPALASQIIHVANGGSQETAPGSGVPVRAPPPTPPPGRTVPPNPNTGGPSPPIRGPAPPPARPPPPVIDTNNDNNVSSSPLPPGGPSIASPSSIILTGGSTNPPDTPSAGGSVTPLDAAAEKLAKRARTRTKVTLEIESTEVSFVESLEALVKLYLQPLQAALDTDPILSQDEISTLFSNISTITALNRKFLTDYSTRVSNFDNNTTLIGDIFLQFAPFFRSYTQYVGNHDNASELLKKLESSSGGNRRFKELVESNMSKPENKNLSVASYLIMPIQRIPRYKLLLEEVLRNTSDDHPDYSNLLKGLESVSAVAKHINAEMHAQENRAAIVRIQNEFSHSVSFVQPHRRFVRQGTMVKKCRNTDKTYEFFLFNDLLVYASRSVLSTGTKYKLHQELPIDESFTIDDVPAPPPRVKLLLTAASTSNLNTSDGNNPDANGSSEILDDQYQFQINNKVKSFIVYVPDQVTKTTWLTAFAKVLNENAVQQAKTAAAKSNTNNNVDDPLLKTKKNETIAPVWKSDKSEENCPCCDKKFTFTKRRHHCRKCGNLCCNDCSLKRMIIKSAKSAEMRDPQRVCDRCVDEITTQHAKAAEHATALARQAMGLPAEPTPTPNANSNNQPPGGPPPAALQGLAAAAAASASKRNSSMNPNTGFGSKQTIGSPPAFTSVSEDAEESDDEESGQQQQQNSSSTHLSSPPPGRAPPKPAGPPPANNNVNTVSSAPSTTSSSSFSSPPPRALPPPPTPPARPLPVAPAAPILVNVCRALYAYPASSPTDLTLEAGDIIRLDSKNASGWWTGTTREGKKGTFPSNYVEELPDKVQWREGAPTPTSSPPPSAAESVAPIPATTNSSSSSSPAPAAVSSTVPPKPSFNRPTSNFRSPPPNNNASSSPAAAATPSSSGGNMGSCNECACAAFVANPFKPTICKDCRHNRMSHS